MTRLVIALDGDVLEQVEITKPRTTIGRRAYNDIVIDHLGVSGEHAAILQSAEGLLVEDLQSTNGTYVNGQAVKHHLLAPHDVIEIGRFRLRVAEGSSASGAPSAADSAGPVTVPGDAGALAPQAVQPAAQPALVRVLNGTAAGREVLLTRERTTFGKPGVLVIAIARQGSAHVLTQVEGRSHATVNGLAPAGGSATLADGDLIDLLGTRLQFVNG